MAIDLKVAQLLASRLCHDLVGPLGAVNAGAELIAEENGGGRGLGGPLEEALALIGSSAGEAAARLSFFRLAFGSGGSAGAAGGSPNAHMKYAQSLARDFFAAGRVTLDWHFSGAVLAEIPLAGVKLLLNMVLLGAEALPRGGRLTVTAAGSEAGYRLRVLAVGAGVRLGPASAAVLAPDLDEKNLKSLDARTVVAHFAAAQAQALGAVLEAETDCPGRVGFQALVSAN
jgi:histidine phosphotransferase ChpT